MATTAAPPPVRIDHSQLRRFLTLVRLQLWWRDTLVLLAASAVIGAVVGFALFAPWLVVACLVLGLAAAVVRRPSVVRAARVADRQLHTASRLATAAEVLDGRLGGALAPAQLDDAWHSAAAIQPWNAYPEGWRKVQLALVALLLSATLVALSTSGIITPPPLFGTAGSADDAASLAAADANAQDNSPLLADAVPADQSSNPAGAAQTLDDVQSQAAQSQAAQTALQKLGDALRPTAAAGDIGTALRAGNYDTASTELTTLATESDQLSRISKRELSGAMERAALDTAQVDPPLAVAEDRVARALNRNVYTETKSTLQDLAKAVGDAKNGVISQEALAKELDALQQQQSPTPPGGGGDTGESGQGYIPDIPGEQPNQVGVVQGMPSTISVPGPEGNPNTTSHSAVGQEAGSDPFGDLTSRLDVPAVDVSVQGQLANDQGRNKPNPNAPVVKISDTSQNGVTPSDVVQPGDPVQAVAEQGVETTEQRSTVRTFFQPPNQTGSTP